MSNYRLTLQTREYFNEVKTIGFDKYLDKNLKEFFEFLFEKADV